MIPKKLVVQVLERDGGWCVIAGPACLGEATVADHRANRGSGGSTVLNDVRCLIAACGLCNGWKADASRWDRDELIRRGLIVLKAATNQETVRKCQMQAVEYPNGDVFWLLNREPWRTPHKEAEF
jgi:hypothetical protein